MQDARDQQHDNENELPDWRLEARKSVAPGKPSRIEFWSYLAAAAIMLPVGWWLKETDPLNIAGFVRAILGH